MTPVIIDGLGSDQPHDEICKRVRVLMRGLLFRTVASSAIHVTISNRDHLNTSCAPLYGVVMWPSWMSRHPFIPS